MIDGPCLAASRYPYEFEAGWFGSVLVLVAGYSETGYLVVEGDVPQLHAMTFGEVHNPTYTGEQRAPEHGRETLPLDAASVDVVISNCVINLAADKGAVFREIARVLLPGELGYDAA